MAEYKDLLQGKTLGHYVISHYVIKDFKVLKSFRLKLKSPINGEL